MIGRVATALVLLATAACGGGGPPEQRTLTVFAASSLTDAFTELATAFEAANEGVTVELNFGSSSSLREQVLGGAPADVFASANEANVQQLADASETAADPIVFATNSLEIVVPAGNPGAVTGLADFARGNLLLGLCAEEVPCGQFARAALAAAGVTPSLDTNEPDVRSLLARVAAGELDAGIVYRTDVLAAGAAVTGIVIQPAFDQVATYPIVVLRASDDLGLAADFAEFVASADGQAVLASYGFQPPPPP